MSLAAAAYVADDYRRGYFFGDHFAERVGLPSLVLQGLLLACLLNSWIFRWKLRPAVFVVAFAIHWSALGCGSAYLHQTREQIVADVAVRAQRAVDAIHAFEGKYGQAPAELGELVPEFLPSSPESLLEWSGGLYYSVDVRNRGWAIRRNPFDDIGLEYAPPGSSRLLWRGERRMGDWIVSP